VIRGFGRGEESSGANGLRLIRIRLRAFDVFTPIVVNQESASKRSSRRAEANAPGSARLSWRQACDLGFRGTSKSGSDCSARSLPHHGQREIIPIAALVDLKVLLLSESARDLLTTASISPGLCRHAPVGPAARRGRNEARRRNEKRSAIGMAGATALRIFSRRQVPQFDCWLLPGRFLGHPKIGLWDRDRSTIRSIANPTASITSSKSSNHTGYSGFGASCSRPAIYSKCLVPA